MTGDFVRITLRPILEAAHATPSFVGWVTRIDAEGVSADGRWEERHGGYLHDQNLARPWTHIESIQRIALDRDA